MNARVFDKVVEVDVGVNTAAHAANDVVCQPIELVDIAQAEGCAVVTSIVLTDYDDQGVALDILFLRSAITVGANNATMTISDNDIDEVLGVVSIAATDYTDFANNQVATVRNIGLVIEPEINDGDSDCSVWMAIRTTGTPTYAGGNLTVKIGVLRG